MGTDIHLEVERKTEDGWEVVDPTQHGYPERETDWRSRWWHYGDDKPRPCERNYTVFGFLADVRNGHGFAGCDTGDPVRPLAPDRGWPEDTTIPIDDFDNFDTGDHSHTWATLRELVEADWDCVVVERGWVDAGEYLAMIERGEDPTTGFLVPKNWCGGVSGGDVRHFQNRQEWEEADRPIAHCYIHHQWAWRILLESGFKRWLDEVIVPMADGKVDDYRVLMGFDS